METGQRAEESTELRALMSEFVPICIREYVADVRKTDWKKCCPFKLSGDPERDDILARLILEDDAADNTINGGPSEGATTRRAEEDQLQNETSINRDAVVAVNDRPHDSVIADDAIAADAETAIIGHDEVNALSDGSQELVSNEVINNDVQRQNENIFSNEDVIPSGNGDGAEVMNDGRPSESSDFDLRDARAPGNNRRRNLAPRKPQKLRRLSGIYVQLGSCVYKKEDNLETELTAESTEDISDDQLTLGEYVRGRRSIRPKSKRIESLNKKRKAPENNHGSDSELGSRYYLRRTKRVMHEHKSKDSSSEDSISSRGRKRNRESVDQEGCSREVSKLLDGNQRSSTKEDHRSRPSHGAERAQHPVQPPIALSISNVETVSGRVQKRVREISPETDDESMAVMQLLRLSNSWVSTPKTAKHKSPSGPDVVVKPASGSMASKPPVEDVNMIDGTAGLANAARTKSVTYRCRISRNPAEFPTENAKKFMRRAKLVKMV